MGTVIVGIILFLLFALALYSVIKSKFSNKNSSCGRNCCSCGKSESGCKDFYINENTK